MSEKIIVCRCEDVTLADLEQALAEGYLDIEEVKRYTGLGTGPCQGKECIVPTCELLAAAHARDPERARRELLADAEGPGHVFSLATLLLPLLLCPSFVHPKYVLFDLPKRKAGR